MTNLEKKNWLALINPASANGKTLKKWEIIKKQINNLPVKYDEFFTEYPAHAISLIKENLNSYDGVIAVGGDGTVHECINGILQSDPSKPLAILPIGTGNDLTHTFQIPLNVTRAIKTIISGRERLIDVGLTIGNDLDGNFIQRYFGGVASLGFDAEVAYDTNISSKFLPGTWNYIRSIFKNLVRLKPRRFKFILDNKNKKVLDLVLCAVGNGKYYGGGMMICPDASVTDGVLNATTLTAVPKLDFLKVFPKVYTGEHKSHPAVELMQAQEFEIKNDIKTLYQADGEILGYTPVKIKLIPKILKIICPKKLIPFDKNKP